jgi:hypothetical protein
MLYAHEAQREETFAPRLSRTTVRLAHTARRAASAPRERRSSLNGRPSARDYLAPRLDRPIHQSLYDDAKYKAQRVQDNEAMLEQEARRAATSRDAEAVSKEHINRMHSAGMAREAELSALREYLHRPVDPTDGQALFAPRVGRGPVDPHARRATGGDKAEHVGMALYDAARQGRLRGWGTDRDQAQREADRRADETAASVAAGRYTSTASALMVAQARRERLVELFGILADEREVAHLDTLLGSMHLLPAEVAAAIEPPLRSCGRMMFSVEEFVSVVERSFALVPPSGAPHPWPDLLRRRLLPLAPEAALPPARSRRRLGRSPRGGRAGEHKCAAGAGARACAAHDSLSPAAVVARPLAGGRSPHLPP